MKELEKLKKLLEHWKEHNNEHAEIYGEWAEKAARLGHEDLSKFLGMLSAETKKLSSLFEGAIKKAEDI